MPTTTPTINRSDSATAEQRTKSTAISNEGYVVTATIAFVWFVGGLLASLMGTDFKWSDIRWKMSKVEISQGQDPVVVDDGPVSNREYQLAEHLIPNLFHREEHSLWERSAGELKRHHLHLKCFHHQPTKEVDGAHQGRRWLRMLQMLTVISWSMFLLAVLYKHQVSSSSASKPIIVVGVFIIAVNYCLSCSYPGNCNMHRNLHDCEIDVTPFDAAVSYCRWIPPKFNSNSSDVNNNTNSSNTCCHGVGNLSQLLSFQAILYIAIIVTVITTCTLPLVKYLFDSLQAIAVIVTTAGFAHGFPVGGLLAMMMLCYFRLLFMIIILL
jgi:hypothetical protein